MLRFFPVPKRHSHWKYKKKPVSCYIRMSHFSPWKPRLQTQSPVALQRPLIQLPPWHNSTGKELLSHFHTTCICFEHFYHIFKFYLGKNQFEGASKILNCRYFFLQSFNAWCLQKCHTHLNKPAAGSYRFL